jgi:hypothetical protein
VRIRPGRLALRALHAGTAARTRLTGAAGLPPRRAAGPFLSCIARLPAPVAAPLCRAVAEAIDPAGVYPPASVHMTIVNLDGAPGAGLPARVGAWASAQPPLSAGVAGIGFSRATAFAVLDLDEAALRAARHSLRRVAGARAGPAVVLRDHVAVVNVARFERPLEACAARRLSQLRRFEVPPFALASVELVRTDKVLSATGTEILGTFALGSPRTPLEDW